MPTSNATIVPVLDPDRGHRRWLKAEIYTGPLGTGRYVPNVDDEVWDWGTGLWHCVSVDYSTGLSRLIPYVAPLVNSEIDETDILLGVGPGYQSESYRVYIDTSVIPHTLAIDSRLRFHGSTVSSVKVFVGNDIGNNGNVISAMYDQGGLLLGENIPCELVQSPVNPMTGSPTVVNHAIKTPMVGYTTQELADNEPVTVVAYDDVGVKRSIARLLVMNTAFIRTTDASKRYITSIHLESPFLSESDVQLLQFPINLPIDALEARGVVTYSDGSPPLRLPIDGTKFSLYGLEHYIATQQGQRSELVLNYRLSPEEFVYGAMVGQDKHMSRPYWATTTRLDGSYSVKLFCFPEWIDEIRGYKLRWFLFNLNRADFFEVTQLVTLGIGTRPFDPTEYGVLQNLIVGLNMNLVDPRYTVYRHVQTIGVALNFPGTNLNGDNWGVEYSPGQLPLYGLGIKAHANFINVNNWLLNISCGETYPDVWLEKVYHRAQPLINGTLESTAPTPNFFILMIKGNEYEFPMSKWNSVLTLPEIPGHGKTLFIRFIRRTVSTDIQLGMGGMFVVQDDL